MMNSLVWHAASKAGVKYRGMHLLARLHAALGDPTKAGRYRQDQAFRIYELIRSRRVATRPSLFPPRRVLFATIRGSSPLVCAFEALLAHALEMRGADTRLFSCDGALSQCDGFKHRDMSPERCRRCAFTSKQYAEAFDLRRERLSAYIRKQEVVDSQRTVASMADEQLEFAHDGGLPVGAFASYSVRYNTFTQRLGSSEEHGPLLRGFVETGLQLRRVYDRLLDRTQPTAIVMLNGLYMTFRILMERGKQRGIPVYTYERGYRKDAWIFSKNQPAALYPLGSQWERIRDAPLTDAENRELDEYLSSRQAGDPQSVFPLNVNPEERVQIIWQRIGLDPGKPTATLFPNSFIDSTTMDFDGIFDSIYQWLDATIRFFCRNPQFQLILRAHPAEALYDTNPQTLSSILRATHPVLPDNIRYIEPESRLSSYALLEMSNASLVYLSTIGIESALKGVPCLLAGRADYRERGFTYDVSNQAEYENLLARLPELPRLSAETVERARRFAYLRFFRYAYELPWFVELPGSWTFSDLALASLDELDVGHDGRFDRLCAAILAGDDVPI